MAFGTGSGLLFIEGQDKTIVWLARVITESGVGFSSSAAADFVSVIASGSWTDVMYTDSGSLVFKVPLLTVLVNYSSMLNVAVLLFGPQCELLKR